MRSMARQIPDELSRQASTRARSAAARLLGTLVLTLAVGGLASLLAVAVHFGFAWLAEQVEWLPALAALGLAIVFVVSGALVLAVARSASAREEHWSQLRRRSVDSRVDEVLRDLDLDTL